MRRAWEVGVADEQDGGGRVASQGVRELVKGRGVGAEALPPPAGVLPGLATPQVDEGRVPSMASICQGPKSGF